MQISPALHKLRVLEWPELEPRNRETLRKAAPQLRIITIEVDGESRTLTAAMAKENASLMVLAGTACMPPQRLAMSALASVTSPGQTAWAAGASVLP